MAIRPKGAVLSLVGAPRDNSIPKCPSSTEGATRINTDTVKNVDFVYSSLGLRRWSCVNVILSVLTECACSFK